MMQYHQPEELIFIDETGIERCLARKYGYSQKVERAEVKRTKKSNKRTNVVSAIACDAYLSVEVLEPGQKFDREVFSNFLRNKVVPFLNPYNGRNSRSVVVLDNHAVHHVVEVQEIIHGTGALLRFLPPYSPDLNPIEGSYNQAKHFIRENDTAFRCCFSSPSIHIVCFRTNNC
ncbi:uncharacterized protein LOC114576492 [Exaiptasia diaphana]|uniref:Tc1-like transposase DDE domain-containing protein n=1 Tax=Exaiptasia diaphana TaxID=2652724 RepID=A0A913YY62_EXADI|nr:uncharacterized protein LOC114576492 [Exaiptasia diaphana]